VESEQLKGKSQRGNLEKCGETEKLIENNKDQVLEVVKNQNLSKQCSVI